MDYSYNQSDESNNGYKYNLPTFYNPIEKPFSGYGSGYFYDNNPRALLGGGYPTEWLSLSTPTEGGYAGYGYDKDQWNNRMDAQSAYETALRTQQGVSRGGPTGSRYGSAANYAVSQPLALQISSLPQLSLTKPQYQAWDTRGEQTEVQKAANPMVREERRRLDQFMALLRGLDPTMQRLRSKDAMSGYGEALSKSFGTANQIGSQRYANKLNYKNQQAASDTAIANQEALANYTTKMNAIKSNAALGSQQQKYRYTDYV
jgi:hypothetical protein